MFPNDNIAKKYAAGRTKTSAIISEMAMLEKESVKEILKAIHFSISTDGSNKSDAKLYPLVVTYYNKKSMVIESTLMSVPNLEADSTGINIANLILSELNVNNIPLKNCLSLGADNAPVMIGGKTGVAGCLKKEIEHLAVIGCSCHLINLAALKGAAVLPDKVDEYLIDIFFYLEKSAKRKSKLQEFQSLFNAEQRKILKHVSTRWLSLGRCLTRLLQQWDPLTSLFKNEVNVQSSNSRKRKRESSPCAPENLNARQNVLSREERIFLFLSSDINRALCHFLVNVLPVFEGPNVTLQSSIPHIHVLRKILINMLKELFSRFLKPSALKASTLFTVEFSKLENQKSDSDIVIGQEASKILENVSKKKLFFKTVRSYYENVCCYIVKKFPYNDEILINAEVACIETIDQASFSSVKFFLDRYPIIIPSDSNFDVIQEQFCSLQMETLPQEIIKERVDKAWALIGELKDVAGSNKFGVLSKVMLSILTLPHSNATCERIFSFVTKTCTQFRPSMSNETLEKSANFKINNERQLP